MTDHRTAAERLASDEGADGLLWIYLLRRDEEMLNEAEYAAWEAACDADADEGFPFGWVTYLGASDGAGIGGSHDLPESDATTAQTAALDYWCSVGITPTWAPRDDDGPLEYDTWHSWPGSGEVPDGTWVRVLWYDVQWASRLVR